MDPKKLPQTDVDVRPLRTFEDDMAQAVEKQRETAISMSVKESARNRREGIVRETPTNGSSRKTLVYLSLFFILAGLVVIGYFYWQSRPAPVEQIIIDTLILSDQEIAQDVSGLSKQDFINLVKSNRASTKAVGTLTNFKLLKEATELTPTEFLEFLGAQTPSVLTRSITDKMMFGLIQLPEFSVPFWVVEVDSFENAFGGMLAWENTLSEDVSSIFSEKSAPTGRAFEDLVSKNKDLRVLTNLDGEQILIYTFLDKNSILITENEAAFREILPLYISSKQIR